MNYSIDLFGSKANFVNDIYKRQVYLIIGQQLEKKLQTDEKFINN